MKKLIVYALIAFTVLSLVGCSPKTPAEKGKLTIGVLYDMLSVESRVRQRDSLLKYADDYGVNLIFQSANGDEKTQLQQAENLISQGVDVLIILAQNTEACKPIILGCKEANIPLVVNDRVIENEDIDIYVGVDNNLIGHMQIDYMLSLRKDGNWALLSGAPTDPNCRIWHTDWMEKLKPYVDSGAIKIVADERCDNWDPNIALKHMENILTVNRDNIDVVMVMNDGLGTGVTQALEARGLAGKVLISGLDGETVAFQRIAAGKQSMTVLMDDVAIAEALIQTAIAAAKGEKILFNGSVHNGLKEVPARLVDLICVDINNLESVVINGGYATREDVYGK